jgi:hypothetical protein
MRRRLLRAALSSRRLDLLADGFTPAGACFPLRQLSPAFALELVRIKWHGPLALKFDRETGQ